jgi:hypothetical protein
MLDRVHKTLKFLANTEGRGNVKPENVDLAIHNRVLEKYEELFFEVNRIINRQNRGLINGGLENLTDKIREKIQHYLQEETVTVTSGSFTIPSAVRYFDTVFFGNTYIELSKNNKEFLLSKSEATEAFPIGLKQSNSIKVLPTTIDEVTISYLRNPIKAKWTYNVVDGVEMYNPSKSDFKDIDIHPSEETDLTLRVLQSFGINLKEQDLQSITEQMKNTEFNKEITT